MLSLQQEQLSRLMTNSDGRFLQAFPEVTTDFMSVLNQGSNTLLQPVAPSEIPVFFNAKMASELEAHGVIGGGPVPQNVLCQRIPIADCTLLQLTWALPNDTPNITQYEIEYEEVADRRPASPNTSDKVFESLGKPVVVPKSGQNQAPTLNDLTPGMQYRFRVRARNIAGWGMWSHPVLGRFPGFPVKIQFTAEKVALLIPGTGLYRITAAGARAKDGDKFSGGRAAVIAATFELQKGDRLEIAVGGMSEKDSKGHSGGGGGTFVLLFNDAQGTPSREDLLIVAGGGGGTRGFDEYDQDGCDASLEEFGTDGKGREHGKGGISGGPGGDADSIFFRGPCWGYGGAGFLTSSTTAKSYNDGLEGGRCGGFGGGGGVGLLGGGGGGGYSGGGGGRGGGGGGSYIKDGAMDVKKAVENDGNGYVVVDLVTPVLSLPESDKNAQHDLVDSVD